MLGPSGCGKTTTLRMIGGFEEATAGTIYLGDADVTGLPPFKRDVNTVFQNYALFPHLTVFENVAFGLRRKRSADARDRHPRPRDARAGASCRATRSASRPSCPAASSSAWRWRARSSTTRAVLLLDEPLGALDLKLRKQMQLELKRIQTEVGITFIYVTHDQEEAMTMSDRIAVMRAGQDRAAGHARGALRATDHRVRGRLPGRLEPARGRGGRPGRLAGHRAPHGRDRAARAADGGRATARCASACARRSCASTPASTAAPPTA